MPSKEVDYWKNDPEHVELMNFLIEKSKDAKSPLNISQLTREFIEKSGSSQKISCLILRIRVLRGIAVLTDIIDTTTKVKIAFALSAPIDTRYLEELRKDAVVKVDGNNRIIKYRAKNGSLELEGDHDKIAMMKNVSKEKMGEHSEDSSQDSTSTTPGSMKRAAAPEVSNSSKRTRTDVVKTEDSAPDGSGRIPENPEIQLLRQPKLEEAPGTSGARPRQEAPNLRSRGDPGAPGAHIPRVPPTRPKPEANNIPAAQINPKSEANDGQTSRIKLFEAMKCLIFLLEISSLSPLQERIEKKIRESSSNEKIANDEMIPAMELMVAKITNSSVSNLSENVESIGLKEFLCYLKAVIMNSKLEELEGLLEKIRGRIKDPSSKDKNIPVEKVASVLQDTLNNVGI